jgi:hypothetical protein
MDVSSCHALFDLRFVMSVLSKTLNGSSANRFYSNTSKAG